MAIAQKSSKKLGLTVLNILVPGLGFLIIRKIKYFVLNFSSFLVVLFVFPVIVGHENQSAVPWGYAFAMLASGLAFWGEPSPREVPSA